MIPPPATPKLIYIVDDEPSMLRSLALFLRKLDANWHVVEFSSPSQALAAVLEKPPHVLISDHSMPEMTGTELLNRIGPVAPYTLRIMLSSYVGFSNQLGGAHLYLNKAYAVRDLERFIRHGLAVREVLQNSQCPPAAT